MFSFLSQSPWSVRGGPTAAVKPPSPSPRKRSSDDLDLDTVPATKSLHVGSDGRHAPYLESTSSKRRRLAATTVPDSTENTPIKASHQTLEQIDSGPVLDTSHDQGNCQRREDSVDALSEVEEGQSGATDAAHDEETDGDDLDYNNKAMEREQSVELSSSVMHSSPAEPEEENCDKDDAVASDDGAAEEDENPEDEGPQETASADEDDGDGDGSQVIVPPDHETPVIISGDLTEKNYSIRDITDHRRNPRVDHAFELLVSWIGFKTPTWEEERNIQAQAPSSVYAYWAKNGGRPDKGEGEDKPMYRVFSVLKHLPTASASAQKGKRGHPGRAKEPSNAEKMRLLYRVQWEGYSKDKKDTSDETGRKLQNIAPEELRLYWEFVKGRKDRGRR